MVPFNPELLIDVFQTQVQFFLSLSMLLLTALGGGLFFFLGSRKPKKAAGWLHWLFWTGLLGFFAAAMLLTIGIIYHGIVAQEGLLNACVDSYRSDYRAVAEYITTKNQWVFRWLFMWLAGITGASASATAVFYRASQKMM